MQTHIHGGDCDPPPRRRGSPTRAVGAALVAEAPRGRDPRPLRRAPAEPGPAVDAIDFC